MKLGYTEFSFGYGFTENLIRSFSSAPLGAPQFPNLVQEGQLAYDVRIDLPAAPIFFQFKLPELMVRNTAKEIAHYRLAGIFCDFFRMPLMRRDLSDQHSILMALEQLHPGRVFYATPRMENLGDFNQAYNHAAVHHRSALFSPQEIGPLPDDKPHSVSYRANAGFGWFCSRPEKVRLYRFEQLLGELREALTERRFATLEEVAARTSGELRELSPAPVEIDQEALRARIRSRIAVRKGGGPDQPSERELDVAAELLTARETARIGLGLEMVVAQMEVPEPEEV